jgi:hypothetical protein
MLLTLNHGIEKYLYVHELNLRLKYKVRHLIVFNFFPLFVFQQPVAYNKKTLKLYLTKISLVLGQGLGLEQLIYT